MNIIGGHYRGLVLKSPPGQHTRPTLGRVREALFNILAPRIPGTRFLDLYAGAGGVGLEALSRGAAYAVFVEQDKTIGRILRQNIQRLDPEGRQTELRVVEASQAVNDLARAGQRFGLIFMDPPYACGAAETWTASRGLASLLDPGGCLFFQHGRADVLPEDLSGLKLARSRRYGETVLSFFFSGQRNPWSILITPGDT